MDELQQQKQIALSNKNNNNLIGPNNNNHHKHQHLSMASDDQSSAAAIELNSQHLCAGCHMPIRDRYLLQALEAYWHEDCLKCSCCGCRLGEVGSNLFTKANLMLCKRDYLRLFGATGNCSACSKPIPAFEMVMRAKSNVYHLDCFACQQCHQRFCVGDRFYLSENQILCEYDYEERAMFGSAGNLNSTAKQLQNSASPFLLFDQRASAVDYDAKTSSERFNDDFLDNKTAAAAAQGTGQSNNSSPGINNGQQQHQPNPEHDASSSGYGSPDSAGGIIDEG